jgi:hypothetical protein
MRPHSRIPGEHLHPGKEQRISVLSGELHVRIRGRHRVVHPGESLTVPAGARHFQWNPTDTEAIVIEEIRPAGRMLEFFRALFRLAREGKTDEKGYPPLLLTAALFAEYGDSIQVAPLPMRLVMRGLAPIARALGYRRRIPPPLGPSPEWRPA